MGPLKVAVPLHKEDGASVVHEAVRYELRVVCCHAIVLTVNHRYSDVPNARARCQSKFIKVRALHRHDVEVVLH